MSGLRPWEPEETIGTLWHRLVGAVEDNLDHPESAVTLEAMRTRMGILLRGAGGSHAVEIRQQTRQPAQHRRGLLQQIGHQGEMALHAGFNGESLDVPPVIASFSQQSSNESAYLWLAVWAACGAQDTVTYPDPLQADLARLAAIRKRIEAVQILAPGLTGIYKSLGREILAARRTARLPPQEAATEQIAAMLLGGDGPLSDDAEPLWNAVSAADADFSGFRAAKNYKPFKPVLLWPDITAAPSAIASAPAEDSAGGKGAAAGTERKRARRRKSDQAERRDSLILHRFETIKTWADVINLNRSVDDDDDANAKKAGSDSDELNLASVSAKPSTRLSFDLDLSPQDIDREKLSSGVLIDEWNHRTGSYLKDHVRILDLAADAAPPGAAVETDAQRLRRIAAIRRQFEALMPRRVMKAGEDEGDDIDTDAAVRHLCDRAAGQAGTPRIFRKLSGQTRDLSVATLLDASRSTESIVDGRPVIEIAREALASLGHGLNATGDSHSMQAFSSLKRDRVYLTRLKGFDEPMSGVIENRIAAVKPGFYTRLGAAIRYTAGGLRQRASARRLLLIITDGKPNDLDYYEGRYGIEDSRRAVIEARLAGLAVFAIAIDRKAESYIPHIFGRNGYAIISHPAKLAEAMPHIFRHLVT